MKKRALKIIIPLIAALISILAVTLFLQQNNASHRNLFEYTVNLQDSTYTFAPQGVSYGMSLEELLKLEKMEEAEVLDSSVVYVQETLTDVSANIDEVILWRTFYVQGDEGLFGVRYSFVVQEEEFEKFCDLLRSHAKRYMPKGTEIPTKEWIEENGLAVCWENKSNEQSGQSSYTAVFANDVYPNCNYAGSPDGIAIHIQVGVGEMLPLSLLEPEECVNFLKNMGFEISDQIWNHPEFAKSYIEEIEADMDRGYAVNADVFSDAIEDVRYAVRRYYGITLASMDVEECRSFLARNNVYVSYYSPLEYKLEVKRYVEELEKNPDRVYEEESGTVVSTELIEKIRSAVKRYYGMGQ